MSALGQKRTSESIFMMSALPPKADIVQRDRHVTSLAGAWSDQPQTVHVAFRSLKPLFFTVRGDMERVMAKKKKGPKKKKPAST
jgi:hypothetical protein